MICAPLRILSALLLLALPISAAERVVIIDPGHGGSHDSGSEAERSLSAANNATSPGGLKEKDLTLELAVAVRDQIAGRAAAHPQTKLTCRLTRTDDSNPDFAQRAQVCASARPLPCAIVSLHFNAGGGKALGTVAVFQDQARNLNYGADHAFATGLIKATSEAVAKFVPGSRAREPISDAHLHGGTGSNFFHQLNKMGELRAVPKCFLEIEFIDRADVDKSLLARRAEAFPIIAGAIAEYLYTTCE